MKIGFIGLGIMGEAMCRNIIEKHDDTVYIFDKSAEKVKPLKELGGTKCLSSLELAEQSEVIISMVPSSKDVEELYQEIEEKLAPGTIVLDMSTIDPFVSIEIARRLLKRGIFFLDAPVVKSRGAAESGELGIYVGGKEEAFYKIKSILSYMGKNIIYLGQNGKGLIMKICHNALVAQIQNGVNETLILAQKNGISVEEFVKAVSYGGGQNFYLDSKAKVLEKEDFTTAFSIQNMYKDLGIFKELALKSQLKLPGGALAEQVYEKAVEYGYEREDFSATYKVVRKDNLL